MQRAEQEIVHQPLLAKTHFVLGRVHVHIHAGGVELQVQHERGMPAVEQHVGIRLTHRVGHDAIAHQPPVDVEILRIGLGARCRGQADPARQMQPRRRMVDAQALRGKLLAQHLGHALQRRAFVAGGFPDAYGLAVVTEPELHAIAGQRQRFQQVVDMREFGTLGTHELAPRRHVVEQVADFDAGALRVLRRARRLQLPAIDLDTERRIFTAGARGQRKARYRRHRRQRLTAEAHAGHVFQIVEAADLAGGVRCHRQRQFIHGDAATIVAYANQSRTAGFDIHLDAASAGIKAVFHQFLDHRRRPLDDLASGDLIDECGG